MHFKSIGLNIAAATVMATGAAISSSPAQALSFNQGTFTAEGKSTITGLNTTTNPTSFTLNFQGFKITDTTGSMAGGALTGTPLLASLFLTKDGSGNFTSTGLTNFVTGLKYKGEDAFLDINPFSFLASAGSFVQNDKQYTLASDGIDFTGVFRTASLSSVSTVSLGAVKFKPLDQAVLTVNVPTPALLPGLVGLGVAALRKRKQGAKQEVEA